MGRNTIAGRRAFRRFSLLLTAAVSLVGPGVVQPSLATLTIDLRLRGANPKEARVRPGGSIVLDVFAVVQGADADIANDGFGQLFASFGATVTSGTPTGTLTASLAAPFNVTGSNAGTPSGLTVGPDPTIPANSDLDAPGGVSWFYATYRTRNQPLDVVESTPTWSSGTKLWYKIGELLVTTDPATGPGPVMGALSVNAAGRTRTHPDIVPATWREDGLIRQVSPGETFAVGTPVLLSVDNAVIDPGGSDVNSDGFVNQLDLNIVGANWLASGATKAQGDANGDTFVNQLDLNLIGATWLAEAGAVPSLAAIPEPGALAAFAVAPVLLRRRRATRCPIPA